MKRIYNAADINEASIVAGMLRARGIEAHVGGYYLQGGIGELAAQDFASVHVEDDDETEARTIIAEYEQAHSHAGENATSGNNPGSFTASVIIFVAIVVIVLYLLA